MTRRKSTTTTKTDDTPLDPTAALIDLLTRDPAPPASTLDVARKVIADGRKRGTDKERIEQLAQLFETRLGSALAAGNVRAAMLDVARKYLRDLERAKVKAAPTLDELGEGLGPLPFPVENGH